MPATNEKLKKKTTRSASWRWRREVRRGGSAAHFWGWQNTGAGLFPAKTKASRWKFASGLLSSTCTRSGINKTNEMATCHQPLPADGILSLMSIVIEFHGRALQCDSEISETKDESISRIEFQQLCLHWTSPFLFETDWTCFRLRCHGSASSAEKASRHMHSSSTVVCRYLMIWDTTQQDIIETGLSPQREYGPWSDDESAMD